MTQPTITSDFLAQVRADTCGRTRRQAEQCVLLAVVTSTDIAASLIDQAVALRASLGDRAMAS